FRLAERSTHDPSGDSLRGHGTRLWPMSRSLYPEQLLALFGDSSLLQQTVLRVAGQHAFAAPLIVANEEHRFIIAEQLREVRSLPEALLLEPIGRNTAPAACVAALRIAEREAEALMLVMPSDHAIADVDAFRDAVERAAIAARKGLLVTFGIAPERLQRRRGPRPRSRRGARPPSADSNSGCPRR